MNNTNKYTSLPLSKKIYDKAKEKGFELPESEYVWYFDKLREAKWILMKRDSEDFRKTVYQKFYLALDTAEWGMILPEIIIFRKDRYELEIKEKWSVDYYFDSYPSCGGMLRLLKEISDQNCFDDNFAEAMGKMYFYLLDNNLL